MRVRAQPDRVDLGGALVRDPRVDEVFGEHASLGEVLVVGLEGGEDLGQRARDLGMDAASSGGSSYRSLSTGAAGSILFLMPSTPAISIAENAR